KAGFHTMASGTLNANLIRRCIKTLIASANRGPHTRSYIIVGICETEETLHEFQAHYASRRGRRYEDTNFYITGINDEVEKYYANNFDTFQNTIISIIKQEPIEASTKSYIMTHLKFPKYYDSTLMILELESSDCPITYEDKYFERHGNNTIEVTGVSAIKALESRFQKA
ncbi:MAG: hypothetical protein IJ920_05070, partial [Paludibacteraceae bacterium]|nr:hypothetical protein [Paludibacteraceae bacterium]